MIVLPAVNGVTSPVPASTEATEGVPLVQVPPLIPLEVNVVV